MNVRKEIFTILSMALVSTGTFSSGTISVVNMNVSGHLTEYSHTKEAYEKLFMDLNKGNIDFVGTEEMLHGINEDFITALEATSSASNGFVDFRPIGRERGGISGQSPDEMVSIFYNASRWTLKEYNKLEDNPVLKNNCNEYTLNIDGKTTQPCKLAFEKAFDPNKTTRYQYTFPLNYVDDNHRSSYFPGDTKNEWGPWNRLATFGVFTSTQASGISPQTTVIVIAAHFPKGKEGQVIYKKVAFESIYDHIVKPLTAAYPGAAVIFMGDLNYNPNRDKNYFNLLDYIKGKSLFKEPSICGNDDDVIWTIATNNLTQSQCLQYPQAESFNTTDHVVTQSIYNW
ncbi:MULTISPECIES: hypothetical protein [Legionella]|uniref:hypothetical protein n=1 Tax=Legionella TaxID=445 RepID=UPI000961EADE|nr:MULTISPECIES: hypothetical protein [Legionella]MBN9228503.1 hypothetical protein [Legionella steelei]OJW08856.1 MAG: hypothetical protein BGO44_11080 [Legionella sp. 39-23]